eukprot:Rmarinus@m.25435
MDGDGLRLAHSRWGKQIHDGRLRRGCVAFVRVFATTFDSRAVRRASPGGACNAPNDCEFEGRVYFDGVLSDGVRVDGDDTALKGPRKRGHTIWGVHRRPWERVCELLEFLPHNVYLRGYGRKLP